MRSRVTAKFVENPFKGWTTIEDAAEILGRNKRTILAWADNRRISSFQVGKKMRVVNIEEVREYAEKYSRAQVVDKAQK